MFSAEERVRKQALIDCFDTQRETLRIFPLDHELFRIAPDYDFDEPPHSPPLSYDHFPWGMTSQRFCELARETRHKFKEATLQQLSVACR